MFVEDESGEFTKKTNPSLSHDQDFSGLLPQLATANLSQITVEQADKKLPRFSGSDRLSQGEVSYRRWQRAATRLVEENISEPQKKKALLKSLQGKADDIADLHRGKSSAELLDVLDKNFGGTVDGDELLIDFYQILQGDKQTASEYVSFLFIELGEVVKFGGLSIDQMPKVLLKQFIRGTSDEDMLNKLKLEDKVANPPTFPDLISSIRREESKRTERRLRHKKQVRVHATTVKSDVSSDELHHLRQRLTELEATSVGVESEREVPALAVPQMPSSQEPEPHVPTASQPGLVQLHQRMATLEEQFSTVRNRNVFCYRCGEDGHLATDCQNAPNKKLVQEKSEARRKRRPQTNSLNY
jgi:hypothetical protein